MERGLGSAEVLHDDVPDGDGDEASFRALAGAEFLSSFLDDDPGLASVVSFARTFLCSSGGACENSLAVVGGINPLGCTTIPSVPSTSNGTFPSLKRIYAPRKRARSASASTRSPTAAVCLLVVRGVLAATEHGPIARSGDLMRAGPPFGGGGGLLLGFVELPPDVELGYGVFAVVAVPTAVG